MPIPAHLVIGAPRSGKSRLIRALAAQRPASERWAVLVAESGATRIVSADDGLVVREVDAGCLCCAAVTLRVEINRLLRSARPARLLVEASALEHAAQTIRLFADFWVAQAVTLQSVLMTLDAASAAGTDGGPPVEVAAALAHADIVVIGAGDAPPPVTLTSLVGMPGSADRLVMPFADAATDDRWRHAAWPRPPGTTARA